MIYLRFILTIAYIMISFTSNCSQIQAQTTGNTGNSNPSGGGRPVNRQPGSRRGNCKVAKTVNNDLQLTALVAEQGDALTISDSPTFLFFVPYVSATPLNARFSLRDNRGYNAIKPILVQLSGTPGIVKIKVNLPKSLEKNNVYRWSFAIICEPKDESKNPVIDGGLRWILPTANLSSKLTKKIPQRELAILYIKEGILLDALALLAEIRSTDPRSESEWNSLLQSLKLGAIAPEKILQCCTLKQ